eukprot:4895041-Prymnesium_polylepis.1
MKQRLAAGGVAEIYESFLQMGQNGVRVDPEVYELARTRLQNSQLCGKHCKQMEPLPGPGPAP